MATWGKGKITCSVCGKGLKDHPAKPCKRGISPWLLEVQVAHETALEKKLRKIYPPEIVAREVEKISRQLYTGRIGRKKNSRTTHARPHNLAKRVQKKPTLTGKIRGNNVHAQNHARRRNSAKSALYNWGC